ncbi:MAG: PilW family protein [Planctomycetota bacterium]
MIQNIKKQAGLSLLEILVALTLGLLVLAGVSQVFVASNISSQTQESLALLQENGRFVVERLKPIGRLANRFTACVNDFEFDRNSPGFDSQTVVYHLDDTSSGYLDEIHNLGQFVVGWNFNGTDVGDTYTLGSLVAGGGSTSSWADIDGNPLPADIASRAIAGSDVLVLKATQPRADITVCETNAATYQQVDNEIAVCDKEGDDPEPVGFSEGQMVLVTDCTRVDVFQHSADADSFVLDRSPGGTLQPGNKAGTWSTHYASLLSPTMSIYSLYQLVYFVRPNAAGEPSLYEWNTAIGPIDDARELIEGVENFQILLGEYNANREVVFLEPDQVTDISRVKGIRLSVLLRQEGPDALQDTATYELNGTTIDPQDDSRIRQVYTTTIGVRNNGELL